jgi:hypothetical protein
MSADQSFDQWGQIVARAQQDATFKQRLVASPAAVLKEQGVNVAPGIEIRVLENTDSLLNLTLPTKPDRGDLADADLAGVAGGAVSVGLVKNLAAVFGWSPKQVDQILGRSQTPVTSGGGDSGHSGADSGAE